MADSRTDPPPDAPVRRHIVPRAKVVNEFGPGSARPVPGRKIRQAPRATCRDPRAASRDPEMGQPFPTFGDAPVGPAPGCDPQRRQPARSTSPTRHRPGPRAIDGRCDRPSGMPLATWSHGRRSVRGSSDPRDDHPHRHGLRAPSPPPHDLAGQSTLAIHRPDQLVDVHDVGLELDDEERLTPRVPGDDIDHASLAVDRERDLGRQDPARELRGEHRRDDLVERGVARVEQSIEITGPPPRMQLEPDVQRRRHRADRVEGERARVAAFDARDRRCRHARPLGEIALPPTTLESDRTHRRSEPDVLHGVRVCRAMLR